ncbi:MAG: hypothetical protein ACRDUV_27260 [Pseudonocardiaceae bacterium]
MTDGSYLFRPEFADIQQKISAENARVRAASSSYVTVALLDPLTPTRNELTPEAVRHRLEGAYTALRRVNDTSRVVGDPAPQVQLVLANEGSTAAQRKQVLDRLLEMSNQQEHPLVAVIGLGLSTQQTEQRAMQLSLWGIPMVGALLPADGLDYEDIPGLIKTSPSNRDYVEALRRYVESTDIDSAVLVRSRDPEGDLYTRTLADEFRQQMTGLIKFPALQFTDTAIPAIGADPGLYASITANICVARGNGLQAVLFAGRKVDLDGFLASLERRTCRDAPLVILTAVSDLSEIPEGREQRLQAANLRVVVAATVDAEGWARQVAGTPEHYQDFLTAFQEEGFDAGHLGDANAIMMHDALLTATKALRRAASSGSPSPVTTTAVRVQLLNLNGEYAVPGASGTLSFNASSPRTGNPIGKPVPVLQYPRPPDTVSRQVGPLYVTD